MRWRQPPNMPADRSLDLERMADRQEICDPRVVEVTRNEPLGGNPVQRVADKPRPGRLGMEKRPYAELVASADQLLARVVPQHKAEVAGDAVQEPVAPGGIGVHAQFGVGYVARRTLRGIQKPRP